MTQRSSILLVLTAGALLFSPANSAHSQLYFSRDDSGDGLYILDTVTGAATQVGVSGVTSNTVGLSESADPTKLFGSTFSKLHLINTDGSGFVDLGAAGLEGLAFDPVANKLYGSLGNEQGGVPNYNLYVIDQSTGAIQSVLADPPVDIEGLAYGNGGVYGLPRFDDHLYFYNPITNSWSVVGDTNVVWNLSGLAYDPIQNVLYGKGFQDTFLYRIDPSTAATVVVGNTGIAQGGGLAFIAFIPIPEPASLMLIALPCVAAMLIRRRSATAQ